MGNKAELNKYLKDIRYSIMPIDFFTGSYQNLLGLGLQVTTICPAGIHRSTFTATELNKLYKIPAVSISGGISGIINSPESDQDMIAKLLNTCPIVAFILLSDESFYSYEFTQKLTNPLVFTDFTNATTQIARILEK